MAIDDLSLQLETERLILKVLGPSDCNAVLDFHLKNKTFLEPWSPAYQEDQFELKKIKRKLEIDQLNILADQQLRFYFFEKKSPQLVAGMCNFNNIIRGVFQSCFLGYLLDEDAQGKGIMFEALSCGVDYIFNNKKLHRIEANIMPRNLRSVALIKRLGFVEEGYSKAYLKIAGHWEDHLRFARLNNNPNL